MKRSVTLGGLALSVARRLSYVHRQQLRNLPGILALQASLDGRMANQFAKRGSRLCLDGFPRSGNGFSFVCLSEIPELPVSAVAQHSHSAANVARAVRLQIPTFVLIRKPLDCCLSLVAMGDVEDLDDALAAWLAFHRRIGGLLDRLTIVPFETLTSRPHLFATAAASAAGVAPPSGASFADRVLKKRQALDLAHNYPSIYQLSLPHPAKEARKAQIAASASPSALFRLESCRALYERILAAAPRVLGQAVRPAAALTREG